jgi:predicted amidophosphoribosyltransferase
VRTADLKRVLGKVGLGWMVPSPDEPYQISLSDVRPINLTGNFDSGFALGRYSCGRERARKRTPLGQVLHRFKYEQDRRAGLVLARLLCDFIRTWRAFSSCDLLITVPPSYTSRPFDPVSFLAEEVERQTQILWHRNALTRSKLTKPQKAIPEREVKELNVSNVYRPTGALDLSGKTVLLLDDTFDSGATLDHVSGMLREAGAKTILVLVVAKTQGFLRGRKPNP